MQPFEALAVYPWFEASAKQLALAYQSGRLPHGLLITAQQGSGKADFAVGLAAAMLCQKNRETLKRACGECKSCQLFGVGNHPDFYRLDRLTDKNGKVKQSIGIDQIRHLSAKLNEAAQLEGWRVTIVQSVNALTTAAFNALLKTLEEPGARTLLLLLADNLAKVPATIRSRCQLIKPEMNPTLVQSWLNEHSSATEVMLEHALAYCADSPLEALRALNNDGFEARDSFYRNLDLVLQNRLTPDHFIESVAVDEPNIWSWFCDYLNRVHRLKAMHQGPDFYLRLDAKATFHIYDKIISYNRAVFAGSNLQPKLQLHAILIQWFEIGRKINQNSKA